MSLRREQIVFALTLVVLALLAWRHAGGPAAARGSRRGGSAPELVLQPVPDLARVLPPGDRPADGGAASTAVAEPTRELFLPPRDTRPLPPLELEEPPRAPLSVLLPPPAPGPAPALYGRFLRVHAADWAFEEGSVPGLFADAELEGLLGPEDGGEPGADDGALLGDVVRSRARSGAPSSEKPFAAGLDVDLAQRTARIESAKRLYDWIQLNPVEVLFGSIQNPDRYALSTPARADESILFEQIDPDTGALRFGAQGAIAYDRERIHAWGFADTVANRLELRFREIDGHVTPGSYGRLLAFADECLRERHVAPRGRELAAEVYRMLAEEDPNDPTPRLGLARCHEAAFDFEAAFDEYERLLGRFAHHADVQVQLAELELRMLLRERAEARLREALRADRASWRAHRVLGRLLLEDGRHAEAAEHLLAASRAAPQDPERLHDRLAIRLDLAAADVALGDLAAARPLLAQNLVADPGDEPSLAAELSVRVLAGELDAPPGGTGTPGSKGTGGAETANGAPGAPRRDAPPGASSAPGAGDGDVLEGAGFDLLLAEGLAALHRRDPSRAVRALEAAAAADPLRAYLAWRALSFVAEAAGASDQALRYVELAEENDPRDPWTLYQAARLYAQRDDDEAARSAYRRALEGEIEFVDVLVALGELAYARGEHEDANRYLERAQSLEAPRVEVLVLRGLNELRLGDVRGARAVFERARGLDPDDPTARAGLAWCTYRAGDPEEAINLLARIDEDRRDRGEDDPYRGWATRQIERIQDHLEKAAWTDRFERRTIKNGWLVDERDGPRLSIADGRLAFAGTFERNGRVRVYQERPASAFVSIEGSLRVAADSPVRAGLFIAREIQRSRDSELLSEASISRHRDGEAQARFVQRGETEPDLRDVSVPFPADTWVRLRIERTGEASESRLNLFLDGIPVVEGVPMRDLGRANAPLFMGFFAEGENGRPVAMEMDDVEIVFRQGV